MQGGGDRVTANGGIRARDGLLRRWAANQDDSYTDRFRTGEALNRTVLPAFTLIAVPVRGFKAFRALVL